MEQEQRKREIIEKGFLPQNDEYDETMRSSMEEVEKNPRRYIIEECIPACQELWEKNIYTFMVSDHLNEGQCWIEVVYENLSDENKLVYMQLEGEKVLKFSYHPGCVNFGVNAVGETAQKELLELAKNFKMQDVPYNEAYITLPEFLRNCGCYKEIENPDYVEMSAPWKLNLPIKELAEYMTKYEKWEASPQSKKTIRVFDREKVTKPTSEYLEEKNAIFKDGRVYLSYYDYKKHLNYLNSLSSFSNKTFTLI